MSEQILAILKRKIDKLAAYGEIDAETRRNALKEELQFYVLNFIYHHPEYSKWIMYGGSALRICHDIDRMSVDLDFEVAHAITEKFLDELTINMTEHLSNTYATEAHFLMIKTVSGRGLLLKFNVGDALSFGHPSKQIHVKLDLNHFIAPKTVTERIPINHDQLSFVIVTYNMSVLMASKIAAIFQRGTRGVGKAIYAEKGRDIYDLLWYMNKKIAPDFDYLVAKGIDVKDPRTLFNKLTIQMNNVSDENLKQDLLPLFMDRTYIENWLENWRESYMKLLDKYEIHTVTTLREIMVQKDILSGIYYFGYFYDTEEQNSVIVRCALSEYWIIFKDGDLPTKINEKIIPLVTASPKNQLSDKVKQYITLFYDKTESYFRKTNKVMLGDSMVTKVIRMTADNFNRNEEILLNKSTLVSCELDDLLK